VSPEKPFIDMKETWTKVWEVNAGGQMSIPVKFSAYPDPVSRWYVPPLENNTFPHGEP